MKTLSIALLFAIFTAAAARADKPTVAGMDGIYDGEITLKGKTAPIPLQIALTRTGETSVIQTGPQVFIERSVIDGAFLIDDEGGPYGFDAVSYNLDKSEIDLRYNRSDLNLGEVAAAFRLVGNVDEKGAISGRVLSGIRGVIGTFRATRTDRETLQVTRKYQGIWAGEAQRTGGGTAAIEFGLGTSLRARNNPPTYEFDYTPGKLGYVAWNNQKSHFNHIAIDYLRKKLVFSDTGAVEVGQIATAECEIDAKTGELVGTLYGIYKGKVATFRLKKFR